MHTRVTKLSHPPVLTRGEQKLTYGPGVPAPWNSGSSAGAAVSGTPVATKGKELPVPGPGGIGKDAATKPIPDAKLFATWDYETKSFKEQLQVGRRGRMASTPTVQQSSGMTISLGMAGRGRSDSKVNG